MAERQISNRWTQAAAVGLGLTASMALVAMAARAPLGRSTPINAASARTPVTAVFVLLVGCGVIALGGLLVVLWPGRRRRAEDEPEPFPEPVPVHWAWKLAAVLLPFALGAVLVAAVVVGLGGARHAAPLGGLAPGRPSSGRAIAVRGGGRGFAVPSWLPWTILAIVVAAAIAAAAWLLLLRRARTAIDERPDRSATRAAVQAAITAIDSAGDPRGAVIAAYAEMERTLAAHGIARSSAEAPREYLRRVLGASSATEREAKMLTGLFEEARFSIHPISERVREAALSALRSLRARLERETP